MRTSEKVAGYSGILLTMVGVAILWLINWVLGFLFSIFVLGVAVWYLKTKKRGNNYLKEVARMTHCGFQRGGLGYGRVSGSYRGRMIGVSVNRGYDSLSGLMGFNLSMEVFNSVMGVLVGIENFTSVMVEHRAIVEKPFKLNDKTYVDKHLMLYLPPSNRITGLPEITPGRLVAEIDRIVEKAKRIETPS